MADPTFFEALRWASIFLEKQQHEDAGRFLLLERQNWTTTQLLTHYRQVMPAATWQQFQADVRRFAQDEPAQYIVGQAPFYGHEFKVTPATLIPRAETEELVEWALAEFPAQQPLRVLDLGTGSGAIAVSLKLARPKWQVCASDISTAALAVATANAQHLGAAVEFKHSDVFAAMDQMQFDLIISNPPYIATSEREVMDASVLAHEPATALFAAESGLAIYRQIFSGLPQHLVANGHFFGEFGYQQRPALTRLVAALLPASQVTFRRDIAGHERMLHIIN
ncbi:peptide chain release factor N(5)-glutamine methyltransferase [Loigolactobacillus zhaoyuanensis]|uniref:Release factor glutamine methyltransferase n=1 Tax=Loigolactobacillus zhaoyuanensis TaxID=2486017 RepID=A0ABW8UDS5_9LACO|nr:peptide chain release factor N(5)-glutamine methyltransferase [Loigolactobacillus zhaoyuanensis]